jgi:hypothetical protein
LVDSRWIADLIQEDQEELMDAMKGDDEEQR